MIGLDTRPRRREGLLSQRAEDSRVLLDPQDGQYYALDEVGGRIWDLCDGTRDLAAVVEELCREYDTPAEEVEPDVLAFVAELAEGHLLLVEP